MTTPRPRRRGEDRHPPLGRLVTVCATALAVGAALQSSLVPLLPRITREHHLTSGQLALVAGIYSVGILVTALPTGVLLARFSARTLLGIAVAAQMASAFLLAFDNGLAALVVSRFLQGVGGCMAWGAAFPWVTDLAPPRSRGRLIGILLSAGVAGGLVGPLVPLAADTAGTRPTFAALGLGAAAACVACFLLPAPPRHPDVVRRTRRSLSLHPPIVLGGWLVALVGAAVGMTQVLGALRMSAIGASTSEIAAVLMVATACQAALNPLAGLVTDRLGPARLIPPGLLAVTVSLALFCVPSTQGTQYGVVLLAICASTVIWGPAVALMSTAARDAGLSQAGVFAVVNLAWAAGGLLGTAGSGIVGSSAHQSRATLGFALVVLATAGTTVAFLRTATATHKKATSEQERAQVSQSR